MIKSGSDLINEAKTRITEIDVAHAVAEQQKGGAVFLDVREPAEWNLGHIPNAVHIPRGQLEGKIEGSLTRDARIIVYCARGSRSALAADTMRQMGYTNIASLIGGFGDWADSGCDIDD